jgi:hypothetical protein
VKNCSRDLIVHSLGALAKKHRQSPHSRARPAEIFLIHAAASWQSVWLGGHRPRVANCHLGLPDMEPWESRTSLFWSASRCCSFSHRAGASLCPCWRQIDGCVRVSPVLWSGDLIQGPHLKQRPHRFKPMQRTTLMDSESGTALYWRTDAPQTHRFR